MAAGPDHGDEELPTGKRFAGGRQITGGYAGFLQQFGELSQQGACFLILRQR